MCNNMMLQFIMAMQQMQMPYWGGASRNKQAFLGSSIMPNYYNLASYPPYYSFGNTSAEGAGGADTSSNLTSMQNMMDKLGFTSANGYSVAQNANGALQFTYNKDGKIYIANSLPDLMNQVNNKEDEKESKSLEDSLVAHEADPEDATDPEKAPDADEPDNDVTDPDNDDTAHKATEKQFSRADLSQETINGKHLEWKNYNSTSDYVKGHVKKGMSVDNLVKVMLPKVTDKTILDKYKQWVIDCNPNGIVDGKVADLNKLDLPVYKTQSTSRNNNNKTTASHRVIAKQIDNKNGALEEEQRALKYNGTNNKIYKKNGLSSWDDDAIFVINGQNYTIKNSYNSKKLDYNEITSQRLAGTDFKLIDPSTGHFNNDKELFQRTLSYNGYSIQEEVHYILNGSGTLNETTIVLENGKVVLKQGNKTLGLMDDVMLGNVKIK